MTPQHVLAHHDAYRAWMHSFGTTTQHVVVNEHACPQRPVFLGATRNHYKLQTLHPGIFPMPCLGSRTPTLPGGLPKKTVVGEPLLKFLLAPPTAIGLDTSEVLKPVEEKEVAEEMDKNEELRESAAALRAWLQSFDASDAAEAARQRFGGPANQPEVLFLGTGAAIPSKYRNVSSVYVSVPSFGGLLLDSGEGSFGQLARRFGFERALKVVEELKVVLISHMHADHHLGLLRILALRHEIVRHKNATKSDATTMKADAEKEGRADDVHKLVEEEEEEEEGFLMRGPTPLVVVGPPALKEWLDEYSSQIQRLAYRFVPCHALNHAHPISGYLEEKLGLTEVRSTEVVHCPFAYGFALTHRSGWKIVYSGDTRPCPQLAEVGRGATLLIHEATFEDGMADEAVAKYHSTTSEALSSGSEMGAEFVAMFHFSQRYPKIPVVESAGAEERMGIAFDLMSTPLHLLPVLPRLLPSLRALFKEDEEGDEGEDVASGK
jgi:ribonuclease Z